VRTGKIVNVKKGQFLSPKEMGQVVDKAKSAGAKNFSSPNAAPPSLQQPRRDMRSIPIMRGFGFP